MDEFILPLRGDAMEYIEYPDESFPFTVWYDNYSRLINHGLPFHWHKSFEILTVLTGKIDYWVSGIRYVLSPGDCLFVNSNKIHYTMSYEDTHDSTVFGMVLLPASLGCFPDDTCYRKFITPVLKSPVDAVKFDVNTETGKKFKDLILQIEKLDWNAYLYELQISSRLAALWEMILETAFMSNIEDTHSQADRHEEEVKAILSYIHTNYQQNISIQDLIHVSCLSRSECFRSFKAFSNTSPIEYLNEYRLLKAADLLCHSSMNITEIFSACGFCSSSYFGKLFRAKYGITPLQYRKKGESLGKIVTL